VRSISALPLSPCASATSGSARTSARRTYPARSSRSRFTAGNTAGHGCDENAELRRFCSTCTPPIRAEWERFLDANVRVRVDADRMFTYHMSDCRWPLPVPRKRCRRPIAVGPSGAFRSTLRLATGYHRPRCTTSSNAGGPASLSGAASIGRIAEGEQVFAGVVCRHTEMRRQASWSLTEACPLPIPESAAASIIAIVAWPRSYWSRIAYLALFGFGQYENNRRLCSREVPGGLGDR